KVCGNFEIGRSLTIGSNLNVKGNLDVGNNASFGGNSTMTGSLVINDDTGSISPITGALIVAGGVGVGENLNVGGDSEINGNVNINSALLVDLGVGIGGDLNVAEDTIINGTLLVNNTTASTGTDNGALVVTGGAGVGGALNVGGVVSVTNSTASTGTGNGALVVTGGAGVGGALNVGDSVNVAGSVRSTGRISQAGALLMPIASIMIYAGTSAPDGYLLCDGSAVSRTTYVDLFSAIGTIYGAGNGSTTFNLPNLTGRMIIGVNPSFPLSTTGGSSFHTLTIPQLPAHNHTGTTDSSGSHSHSVNDPGHSHSQINGRDDGNVSNQPGQAPPGDGEPNETGAPTESAATGISINSNGAHTHSFTTASTGSNSSFSLLNPYIALNYIIKF
ncbi:MAG: tail fiber protein, partial [Candidatus Paceibacterota bacterium]